METYSQDMSWELPTIRGGKGESSKVDEIRVLGGEN